MNDALARGSAERGRSPATLTEPVTTIIVGDPTVDWLLVAPPDGTGSSVQLSYRWDPHAGVGLAAQPGGAALLTDLLTTCARNRTGSATGAVIGLRLPIEQLRDPGNLDATRTFSLWSLFPRELGSRESAWRVREWLGQWPARSGAEQPPQSSVAVPAVLVIDDTSHGFRDAPELWPASLGEAAARPASVVLRMANPLTRGPLWERLLATCADILTVCVIVGDLRKEFAPIGQPLSWERTSRDVIKAVRQHPRLPGAARVVVVLGLAGAVIVERGGGARLVFDPARQEGDWERVHPGTPFAVGSLVTAALADALARAPAPLDPDWGAAVAQGLRAARALHEQGFTLRSDQDGGGLVFPLDLVAPILAGEDGAPFRAVAVPEDDDWTLLDTSFPEGSRAAAERITVEGIAVAARELPVERMGAWASVDRAEIESMRSVRNIVREYLQQPRRTRPLSLAVFGPPGAGKSFAVKQMAGEWSREGTPISVLEFNVAQFGRLDALATAFQRVRDCAVEGTLPLVFWDEFDARRDGQELGWLAQFLAPMQDGAFLDGDALRPIGGALFVFAGGTHATMTSFKGRAERVPGAKATDFLSRLRGYIDILGPNPATPTDRTYLLRRALLLRPLLERRAPQLFSGGRLNIDPGILRALLEVSPYAHGARSMESIVEMSALTGKLRYERSALPAHHQLGLHVDADRFLALVAEA